MSTVFGTWPRLYLTPEDEPDEGGRVVLLRDTHVLALPVSDATVRAYTSIPVHQMPVSINATAALHQLTHQEEDMTALHERLRARNATDPALTNRYDPHTWSTVGDPIIGRPLPERERGYLRGVALEAAAGALICAVLLAIFTAIVKGGWPL